MRYGSPGKNTTIPMTAGSETAAGTDKGCNSWSQPDNRTHIEYPVALHDAVPDGERDADVRQASPSNW